MFERETERVSFAVVVGLEILCMMNICVCVYVCSSERGSVTHLLDK